MNALRSRLAVALLSAGLLLLVYLGTILVSGPIGFLYRNAPGFDLVHNLALAAAWLTTAGAVISAAIVALAVALKPAPWSRRWLSVLPAILLGLAITGLAMNALGVGTTGTVEMAGTRMSFAMAWLLITAVVSAISIVLTAATTSLAARVSRAATTAIGITAVPAVLLGLAMIATLAILATNQPRVPSFGNPAAAESSQSQRPPSGQAAPATPAPQAAPSAAGQPESGRPAGAEGSSRITAGIRNYQVGAGLVTVLALITLAAGVWGLSTLRSKTAPAGAGTDARIDWRSQLPHAFVAGLGVIVILLAAIQFVPVAHASPAAAAQINWDSPQTQALFSRACGDCHSNATRWPWYSYVAPASWLNVVDVNAARAQFNLSEIDKIRGGRRTELPNEIRMQIENGLMPPRDYEMMHPDARLSAAEKQELIRGLQATITQSP